MGFNINTSRRFPAIYRLIRTRGPSSLVFFTSAKGRFLLLHHRIFVPWQYSVRNILGELIFLYYTTVFGVYKAGYISCACPLKCNFMTSSSTLCPSLSLIQFDESAPVQFSNSITFLSYYTMHGDSSGRRVALMESSFSPR